MMSSLEPVALAAAFGALLVGYAAIDAAFRRDLLLRRVAQLFGSARRHPAVQCLPVALVAFAAAPFWRYQSSLVAGLAGSIASLLAYNAATKDRDPVDPLDPSPPERVLLAISAVGSFASPACLLLACFLLSSRHRLWQHHATLPMRLAQVMAAYEGVNLIVRLVSGISEASTGRPLELPGLPTTALASFLVIVQVSHYFITALAKAFLGPRWFSWVTENRLHYLPASAYSWGWGRFVAEPTWLKLVAGVRRVEVPLQGLAFGLEALSPLALLDARLAALFSFAAALFHVGVFALSGLLFWDWVAVDLLLGAFLWLGHESLSPGFGLPTLLLGLTILAVFPLRHRLWRPMPLGWYDSPLTQRIEWQVVGQSGAVYGLYNNFMCPHERLYGRVHGCFLTRKTVLTYHLGEVWKLELRDAIVAAGPDHAKLDHVRERFGILPYSDELGRRHLAYLRRFFWELNRGAPKQVLPQALSFLKAPGDQIYYFGDLSPYTRQEPACEVRIRYREQFFDGERYVPLADEELASVAIPTVAERCDDATEGELTPKELDDYLLELARGRLINWPGEKRRYLEGDDGKPARPRAPRPASANLGMSTNPGD